MLFVMKIINDQRMWLQKQEGNGIYFQSVLYLWICYEKTFDIYYFY